MTDKLKRFIKRIVVPTLLATVLAGVLSYFIFETGFPAAHGLNETDIASVKIAQGDEAVTLTSKEDIAQAAALVKILSFRFGKAGGGSADTTYIFDLKDGSKTEIGANGDTIFKNGKIYPGVKDSCAIFGKCTRAFFSL